MNLLRTSGHMLRRGTDFWRFKEQIEENENLGTWDERNHEWQLQDAEGELSAIADLTSWLEANTINATISEGEGHDP